MALEERKQFDEIVTENGRKAVKRQMNSLYTGGLFGIALGILIGGAVLDTTKSVSVTAVSMLAPLVLAFIVMDKS
ncbi:MAG: hypothetical protein ACR2IV_17540 [Bryobacteraceae bacterium]